MLAAHHLGFAVMLLGVLGSAPAAVAQERVGTAKPDATLAGAEVAGPATARHEKKTAPQLMLLGGVGLLALPFAELCPAADAPCEPAETGIGFSVDILARISNLAFGGGISWAAGMRPTSVSGDPSLERRHSRAYFLVGGSARYYLPRISVWDWWLGAHAGGVIINDSWSTVADREPAADTDFVGPRSVTLRTEGLAMGLGAGVSWRFAERFIFGTQFQYANWVLPGQRDRTPLGDQASLAGRVDVLHVGGQVGILLPL